MCFSIRLEIASIPGLLGENTAFSSGPESMFKETFPHRFRAVPRFQEHTVQFLRKDFSEECPVSGSAIIVTLSGWNYTVR